MRAEAGLIENLNRSNEKQYRAMLSKKWAATNSLSYFRYVLALSNRDFKVDEANLTELDRLYLTMLHYDFWQEATTNMSLSESIATIGSNKDYSYTQIANEKCVNEKRSKKENPVPCGLGFISSCFKVLLYSTSV